jgi:hypothetical protein
MIENRMHTRNVNTTNSGVVQRSLHPLGHKLVHKKNILGDLLSTYHCIVKVSLKSMGKFASLRPRLQIRSDRI